MAAQLAPVAYHFESTWGLAHPAEAVWAALTDPSTWPKWWRGLEASTVAAAETGHVGSRSDLVWRAPTGYRLGLALTLTKLDPPHFIAFTSAGDLAGTGSCTITAVDSNHTSLRILWDVSTMKPWMNRYARLLGPVFRLNHGRLMSAGEQGLRAYLNTSN